VGVVAILAAAVGYAVGGMVIARYASRVDALSIAAVRGVVVPFFLVPLLFLLGAQGDVVGMSASTIWQLVLAGLIGWGIGEPLYVLSIHYLGLTRSYMLVTGVYSLGAFIFPVLVLGEDIGAQAGIGAALVLAGVYLVAWRGIHRVVETSVSRPALARPVVPDAYPPIAGGADVAVPSGPQFDRAAVGSARVRMGVLFAVVAAVAWAIDSTWIRATSDGIDAIAIAIVHVPAAAFGTALFVYGRPRSALRRRRIDRRIVGIIALSSILSGGIGSVLFVFAIQDIGTGPAAVLFATSPLFALPLAAIFLRERLTPWAVAGTALAIAGIALLA
jgi:drug/metabolite transporter (DMT)-like permease